MIRWEEQHIYQCYSTSSIKTRHTYFSYSARHSWNENWMRGLNHDMIICTISNNSYMLQTIIVCDEWCEYGWMNDWMNKRMKLRNKINYRLCDRINLHLMDWDVGEWSEMMVYGVKKKDKHKTHKTSKNYMILWRRNIFFMRVCGRFW